MTDYRDYIAKAGAPVVSHEIGQWCVYPNFDEIPKYKGWLKAKNFGIFRDSLKANGMADLARPFLIASGKLQALCYKEDIKGLTLTPRQDNNRNGLFKDYAVYVSDDGKNWGQPVAKGAFRRDALLKEIKFAAPTRGKFLKLEALSGSDPQPFASLAEVELW